MSGIKRHVVVDTQGFLHAVVVTTADWTDRDTGEKLTQGVARWLPQTRVEVVKRSELHTFAVLPKRWIVERSFGWLDKNRRLWKNCERKLNTSLQFVLLSFIALLLRRL